MSVSSINNASKIDMPMYKSRNGIVATAVPLEGVIKQILLLVFLIGAAVVALFFLAGGSAANAGDGCLPPTLPANCVINKDGTFSGYATPWPPGCAYLNPGHGSASQTATGNWVVNPVDHTVNSKLGRSITSVPQCRPSPCPKAIERCDYPERGHRMQNVGSFIDKNGCSYWYDSEGNPLPPRCNQFTGSGYGESSGADPAGVNGEEANFSVGWIDQVTCDGIKGWAYDADNIAAPVTVHVYIDGKSGQGGKLLTSGVADQERTDINELFGIPGKHGFNVQIPDTARDGKAHTIYIYAIDTNGGQNRSLGGGGRSFTCTGTTGVVSTNPTAVPVSDKTAPVGWFDTATPVVFTGWGFDADNANAVIDVHFYADNPVDKGGKLIGFAKTTVQRDDINKLYNITGTHGFQASVTKATTTAAVNFTANIVVVPLVLQDGKAHAVYAYAIDSNGNKNHLAGGSPKSMVFGTTSNSSGGGGAGGSTRHNDLSDCEGTGLFGDEDPGIGAVIKNGKIELSYGPPKTGAGGTPKITVDGKEVSLDGGKVTIDRPDASKGGVVTVVVNGKTYYVDTEGVAEGGTVSMLVPMPCVRIGYNDVGVGESNSHTDDCGTPGHDATCADELDGFLNIDGIQAAGLHVDDATTNQDGPDQFTLEYKVIGGVAGTTVAGKWTAYDWRACQGYISHCIRLKGKGTLFGRTKVVSSGGKFTAGHYSLAAAKEYDSDADNPNRSPRP